MEEKMRKARFRLNGYIRRRSMDALVRMCEKINEHGCSSEDVLED